MDHQPKWRSKTAHPAVSRIVERTVPDQSWDIQPFVGVGVVKFGMSSEQIKDVLGMPDTASPRTFDGTSPVLEYRSGEVAVSFNPSSGTVDSVRFWHFNSSGPTLHGRRILGQRWEQVVSWLEEWGYECKPFDAGVDCPDIGLSLSPKEDDQGREIVDVVIVWADGYLDTK